MLIVFSAAHTQCVINNCTQCSRPFRTYVPGTTCELPDGNLVSYQEPQEHCPLCDTKGYGDFMNMDMFPELSS